MSETRICVDRAAFNIGEEYSWLAARDEDGAVVTFTGKVRNHNLGDSVSALTLEHYPGMTEKSLAARAGKRLSPHRRTLAGRRDCLCRRGERAPQQRF